MCHRLRKNFARGRISPHLVSLSVRRDLKNLSLSIMGAGVPPEAATDVSDPATGAEDKEKMTLERMRKVVDTTPGATIFTEGMKVPGQEEREQLEAEWMRGDFEPVDDGAVYGRRLERGEGRTAEDATGPQPSDWDDVIITLRGTPVVGCQDVFFAPRGAEAACEEGEYCARRQERAGGGHAHLLVARLVAKVLGKLLLERGARRASLVHCALTSSKSGRSRSIVPVRLT